MTSFSVTESREPLGAFKLITNWPASVRGKKERPSKGKIAEAQHKRHAETQQASGRAAAGYPATVRS